MTLGKNDPGRKSMVCVRDRIDGFDAGPGTGQVGGIGLLDKGGIPLPEGPGDLGMLP